MPINLDPNNSGISYSGADIEYSYPNGLDLQPTSHTHQVLLTKLLLLAQESSREMSKRHSSWKKIDRTLTAYIPLDEKETLVQENDERKPVSIVIPYSFATLETLLTYFSAAFLDYPIFKYEGTSPEDRVGAMLMEKVIEQQSRRSKMALALLTTFRDSWAYGFGSAAPYWDKVYGKKTTVVDAGFFSAIFGKMLSSGKKRQSVDTILYEGNFLRNIDPYMTLPDPNVPIHEVQKGEYFGWIDPSNYKEILNNERNDKSYFNARYLSEMRGSAGRSQYNKAKANSGRDERFGTGLGELGVSTSPIDRIFMYVNIIPKEWQLGTSEYPEKWLFCIAADKVILCAKPLGLDHNMFPVATASPDYDGYSVTPISRLELISGLQTTLDWLVNSHIANVRKSINDMLVVDPSLVNINDLLDPAPGKLIRMRRAAWGRGVENAVKQLAVTDITRSHIQDSAYITELIKTCSGSVDSVMGLARSGSERVSADESRGTRMAALSRLAKAARVVSLQMMTDLSYMLASHTQQLMSRELYVSVTGRWEEELMAQYPNSQGRIKVSPFDISIDYDIQEGDGTLPTGENADVMVQLFQSISSQPILQQQFDIVRIFQRIAMMMGIKDVNEFKNRGGQMPQMNATALPDQTVLDEAQKGNLVPLA
ncbi:MAG: hypothetical protein WC208_14950 [Gallionella sp.]|jgi:hypothetical protein